MKKMKTLTIQNESFEVVDGEARTKIAALTEEIAKLPTGGGTQSDWSVNDESDPAYVKYRTHGYWNLFNYKWDGVIGDRTAVPLDAFGLEGYFLVFYTSNGHSVEEISGATICMNDGATLVVDENTLVTDYPGAVIEPNCAIAMVTDADLFEAVIGSYVGEGLYFLCNPNENLYVESFVGRQDFVPLLPRYLPALAKAYPTAATKTFIFHLFNGEIPDSAFKTDGTIEQVKSSVFVTVGGRAFMMCSKLSTVDLPNVKSIGVYSFYSCKALASVDFTEIESIGYAAFENCEALSVVILRNSKAVVECSIEGAVGDVGVSPFYHPFSRTQIGYKSGYIYVPRALMDSYKTAAYWSNLASQFRALEDYTVDGTITGELDESKI